MNLALRPATVDALRRFRSRRSNLLWLRAFLCIAGLAVGLLVVLALLHDELMRYEAAAKTYQAAIEVGLEARAPEGKAEGFYARKLIL